MSRKSRLPQSRHHILVYDEDWEWLEQHFGASSSRPIGIGPAIREIIHKHLENIRDKFQQRLDTSHKASHEASHESEPKLESSHV